MDRILCGHTIRYSNRNKLKQGATSIVMLQGIEYHSQWQHS